MSYRRLSARQLITLTLGHLRLRFNPRVNQSHLLYVLRAGCSLRAGLSSLTTHACSVLYIWTDHEYAAVPLLMETEYNWGNRGLDVTAVNNHLLTRDQEMKEQLCKLKCPCLFIAGHSSDLQRSFQKEKKTKKKTTTTKDPWLHFSGGVCYIVPRKNNNNEALHYWPQPLPYKLILNVKTASSHYCIIVVIIIIIGNDSPAEQMHSNDDHRGGGGVLRKQVASKVRQWPCVVKFQHQATPSQRQRPQQVPLVSS